MQEGGCPRARLVTTDVQRLEKVKSESVVAVKKLRSAKNSNRALFVNS